VRAVVLSPSLPLAFSSTDARWLAAVLPELVRAGHAVTCISCTERPADEVEDARRAAADGGFTLHHVPLRVDEPVPLRKLRSAARPRSEYARVPELRRVLARELATPHDVLHVEHLFPAWSAPRGPKTVAFLHHLEAVDLDGANEGAVARIQVRRATRGLLRSLDRIVAATPRIRDEALRVNPHLAAAVAPVVLDAFRYERVHPVAEPVVGLIGSMHWHPSRRAAERLLTGIWPEVRRRRPEARLLVGGWNAERYLGRLFPLEGAQLVDRVDEPRDFFSRIGALVYPTPQGTGVKIKVLEGMAFGVPVVSNADGFEGLDVTDAEVVRADTDADFVDRTVELLDDAPRRRALADAARTFVEQRHSPHAGAERLVAAWHEVLP
jgi:glycosyltransferase involved in cell wall biosynthesis